MSPAQGTSSNMSTNTKTKLSKRDPRLAKITPQARTVLQHMSNAGTITQREALIDHSVQSLTRRITELRDAGFKIEGRWKQHPITGQRYTRYSFVG
jgi:hypothetical protein